MSTPAKKKSSHASTKAAAVAQVEIKTPEPEVETKTPEPEVETKAAAPTPPVTDPNIDDTGNFRTFNNGILNSEDLPVSADALPDMRVVTASGTVFGADSRTSPAPGLLDSLDSPETPAETVQAPVAYTPPAEVEGLAPLRTSEAKLRGMCASGTVVRLNDGKVRLIDTPWEKGGRTAALSTFGTRVVEFVNERFS